jgi:hypothetical protein
MARKILIGLVVVVALFLGLVATRPSTFRIERSLSMTAMPHVVFGRVNDFHAWARWSPWEQLDPNLKRSYSGAPSGAGAIYEWVGNDDVGQGRMTIVESIRASKVGIKLEFLKPWQATNHTTFSFVPDRGGTKVTWAMEGQNNFMMKAATLFMDMDKMVGADFERGLNNLNRDTERAP